MFRLPDENGAPATTTPDPAPAPASAAEPKIAEPPLRPAATGEKDEVPRAPAIAPKGSDVYLGGRYRGFLLPQSVVNAFGRGGKNLVFQSASVETDIRKGGFSIVPAVTFADLSTGDMLLGSRSNDLVSSFSYVRSEMKAVAASVGFEWSIPVSGAIDFELGLELGAAGAFGPLTNVWVYETNDGPLSWGGRHFAACKTVNDGVGCRPQDHGSPTPVRVGDYHEPSIFSGGKAPSLLPWVSLPVVGMRARLGDDVAMRIGIGASFTGLWAGASLDYAVAHASAR
jgi:hypothetical protein